MGDFDIRYPDPALALDKMGINAYLNYKPSDKIQFDVSGGYADVRSQHIYVDVGAINFTTGDAKSAYFNFHGNIHDLTARFSITSGEANTLTPDPDSDLSSTMDAEIEYDIQLGPLSLRPGLSMKSAKYEWVHMGGNRTLTSTGFGVRADYQADKFRLVAGIRGDKYSKPEKVYPSYQLSALYQLNEKHLIRTVYSRANRAAFLAQLFFDMDIPIPFAGMGIALLGNDDLSLMTQDMFELGYRAKWSDKLQTDIEGFYSFNRNYADLYSTGETEFRNVGGDDLMYFISQFQNLDVTATQMGATASLNYLPSSKFHFKAFVTLQQTNLKDYAPDVSKIDSTLDFKHTHTPDFFGGVYMNFKPFEKMNINVSAYTYSKQIYDHADYSVTSHFPPFTTTNYVMNMTMKGKVLLNVNASYALTPWLTMFVNARNVLNDDTQELGFAEKIGNRYLAGIRIGQ